MKCNECGTKNDKDALFCKKCGNSLVEEKVEEKVEKKTNNKSNQKPKTKTKTKVKNNTKTKTKTKVKNEKEKEVKVVTEKENSTGKNFLIFFLTVLVIGLLVVLGWFGYDYYQKNYNISVPNFVGMEYDDAKELAFERNLKVEKIDKITEDEKVDRVLKQNRSPKSKVKKNTIIRLDVGVKDTRYKVAKFIDRDIDDVKEELDKLGIKYKIEYNEDICDDGEVLNQHPFAGERMDKERDTITLLVCKEDKSASKAEKSDDDDKNDDKNDDNDVGEETTEDDE